MKALKEVIKLVVKYNDTIVGTLFDTKDHGIAFQYDINWLKEGFSISPLFLPLSEQIFYAKENAVNGLFGAFNDTLPDGWGLLLTIRQLAKQGIDYNKLSPLTKLSMVSNSASGALRYEPLQYDETKIESNPNLDDLCDAMINTYQDATKDLDRIYLLGGSSGGARPKILMNIDNVPWIIKFPCRFDDKDCGIKEFQYNQTAQQAGINVNEHQLFPSKLHQGYFGAKRFDIDPLTQRKIHFISLCGVLETSHTLANLDYLHLFKVIDKICVNNKTDKYEAFKQMCFNVIFKNTDDHGKNFGFLYDEAIKGYKLSPAYDLTSLPYDKEHEMMVNHHGNPTIEDCIEVGKIIGICEKDINVKRW